MNSYTRYCDSKKGDLDSFMYCFFLFLCVSAYISNEDSSYTDKLVV